MKKPVRWGILGLGDIATKFATGLTGCPGACLLAVGSRTQDKADAFAHAQGAARAYGSYAALVADPDVDVVYVATPHTGHREAALLCLRAGKAVLCEKPITVNAGECAELIRCARRARVFLMEAMWTRFVPAMVQVRRWLAAGAVGDVRMVTADFGFRSAGDPLHRHLNPALAGGGLLDVGVYTLAMASMVLGRPRDIIGRCHLGATGVDEQAAMLLTYAGGRLATLSCAVCTETPQEARILGTRGSIHIPKFWHAAEATLTTYADKQRVTYAPGLKVNGYEYEAMEVGRCLRQGLLESPVMPLAESLAIQRQMDALRRQWGLRYPGEGGAARRRSRASAGGAVG